MQTGEKIIKLRKEKGISQEAFAEALGVSRQSVSKWESGLSAPDIDKIVAMSEYFGVSTDYLLKDLPGEDAERDGNASGASENGETSFFDEIFGNTPEAENGEPSQEQPESENVPEQPESENSPEQSAQNTGGFAPYGASYVESTEKPARAERKKLSSTAKGIIAFVVAACIVAAAIAVPIAMGKGKKMWWSINGGKVEYTYVLVHGMGGWGDESTAGGVASYWGATTGRLADYLKGSGYKVCVPTVGPYSSTWDRTCELYAQLTGTQVDYGEAHSKAHGHERYGRTYTTPMVENWGEKINGGQRVKVNLIGHSFGGETVRMLTSLLATGNADEVKATGEETSPLFTGGKEDWVFSVTTLCSPHNGSQLTCTVDGIGKLLGLSDTSNLLMKVITDFVGAITGGGQIDLMLDQFGLKTTDDIDNAVKTIIGSGEDNAIFELSPDGAAALNKRIKTVEGVYYFSYASNTMQSGSLFKNKPGPSTLVVLRIPSRIMAGYTGTTEGGIVIDESWAQNDGLVSVVSAQYPFGENHAELPSDPELMQTGIWYVAPTLTGDHGTVIGLNASTVSTHKFYDELFGMIEKLVR